MSKVKEIAIEPKEAIEVLESERDSAVAELKDVYDQKEFAVINRMSHAVHDTAVEHGFWEGLDPTDVNVVMTS